MSTRASIDASATLTDRTLPSEVPSALPEALQTHAAFNYNYKNDKAVRSPLGKSAFAEEAFSDFLSRKTVAVPSVRLSARPDLSEALDGWLNGGKL